MSSARRGRDVDPSSRASAESTSQLQLRNDRPSSRTSDAEGAESEYDASEELTLVTTKIHEILENVEHSDETRKDEDLLSGRENVLEHLVEENELARSGDDVFFDRERLGFSVGEEIPSSDDVSDRVVRWCEEEEGRTGDYKSFAVA